LVEEQYQVLNQILIPKFKYYVQYAVVA